MKKNQISSNEIVKVENIIDYNKKLEVRDKTFEKLMFVYSLAIRQLEHNIKVIKDEYDILYDYRLIDNIQSRIKSPESIVKKMENKKLELTYKNMMNNINDIAGIRIICPLKKDIYTIQNILEKMDDVNIIKEKDYVKNPKESGYSSYHIVAEVPIKLSQKNTYIKTEIQIRTITMDFWAGLEHKMMYKPNGEINIKNQKEWKKCAKLISKIDEKMMLINN